MRFLFILIIPALALSMLTGCGKKGPPQPPLLPGEAAGLYNGGPAEKHRLGAIGVRRVAERAAQKEIL